SVGDRRPADPADSVRRATALGGPRSPGRPGAPGTSARTVGFPGSGTGADTDRLNARYTDGPSRSGDHSMSRTVFCRKYREELPGLDQPPFPGPKGQEIFEQVSRRAWEEWLAHQTMLINERKLNAMDMTARAYL